MQFSPDLRPRVLNGEIEVSFRLWTRPKVRVGGVYRVGDVAIEVDDIELVPFGSVSNAEVQQSGEANRESLRDRVAHAGPVHDDTLVYRIAFHVVSRRDR